MKSILSGDASQITQALAPQISNAKVSAQQDSKTQAMLGGRSGGTAAFNATAADRAHSDITKLIGDATSSSASTLASIGSNLLGQGMEGTQAAFGDAKQMQAQRAAQWNDIFKSGTSLAAGVIGGLPGSPGGWQDVASNALAA